MSSEDSHNNNNHRHKKFQAQSNALQTADTTKQPSSKICRLQDKPQSEKLRTGAAGFPLSLRKFLDKTDD